MAREGKILTVKIAEDIYKALEENVKIKE